jgi:PAS domain S-box-containing protein
MDSWFTTHRRSLFIASLAFLLSSASLVLLLIVVGTATPPSAGTLFFAGLACCLLISKNVYDAVEFDRISDAMKQSQADAMLGTTNDLFSELYYNSPVPYYLLDRDGLVVSANLAGARLLQISQERINGVAIFSHLSTSDSDHLEFMLDKYQSGLSISDEEVLVRRATGEVGWALMSLFRFKQSQQQGTHALGLLTLVDVTRQKEIERAKSEFVSLASHQLRTPIAGMKWSAELLLMDQTQPLTDQQRKYIDRLIISIKRMSILVDDFLRVSRFELGTFKMEVATFSLPELVRDIMAEQEVRVTERGVTVKTIFDEHIHYIETDQNLIRMIVTNLYTNAIKYTPSGGVVELAYSQVGDTLKITVADNGMGIPIADQPHIFKKLYRASNATRDVPDGTGLGLYIVQEAVRVLRGRISFTSTERVGTTFEVVLPVTMVSPTVVQS